MKPRLFFFFLLFIPVLAGVGGGCRRPDSPPSDKAAGDGKTLTVSAAVSLKDAFGEIGNLYKSKTGVVVSFNFGASGALQRQIETGAPVDVFASAGERQMDELAAKDLIDPPTRRSFAHNKLVLVVPAGSKTELADFAQLTRAEGVQKIAVGNPKTVPAGQYAAQVFDRLNLRSAVEPKLIFAEDVRQVLDYVVRGETDAGIVYATDAALVAGEKIRVAATAPEGAHDTIFYSIAVVRDSARKTAAREFLDLVLSAEGRSVLRKYGFAPVTE